MDWECGTDGVGENTVKNGLSDGQSEGKRPLGVSRRRWDDNNTIKLKCGLD
jgi:hypothetical protein